MWRGHTKVCWVVIGWTIKAQSLQIGDEVRDSAFVDTLSLTENVKLQRNKIIHGLENWPYIQVLMMSRTGAPRGKTSLDKTGANWWADAHFLLIRPAWGQSYIRTQMKKYLCHDAIQLCHFSLFWKGFFFYCLHTCKRAHPVSLKTHGVSLLVLKNISKGWYVVFFNKT